MLRYVAVASSAALVAACQPTVVTEVVKETVVVERVVEAPKEPVEIVHMERTYKTDIDYRTENAANFVEMHPNIRVTIEVTPEGYAQTIQARIAAGTAGDVFRYATHFGMSRYTVRGLIYPLDEFAARDSYDLEVFFPGALEGNKFQGKLYALPINGHAGYSGVYYMPELWAEAGVKEPTEDWTFDELDDAIVKLTKDTTGDGKTDQWGIWFNAGKGALLTPVEANGGWTQNDDATMATWDDPKTQAGVQWVSDVYNTLKAGPRFPSGEARYQLWAAKKWGLVFSGVWEGMRLSAVQPEGTTLKFAPGPVGVSGKRGGYIGCNNYPIWRTSQHPDESWEWVKYLASRELGIEGTVRLGEPGLRWDVFEDPSVSGNPLIAPCLEMLKAVRPYPEPGNGYISELMAAEQPILDGIYLEELTVDEGCAELQRKAQDIFDRPPPAL